jgi:hypothetical protein
MDSRLHVVLPVNPLFVEETKKNPTEYDPILHYQPTSGPPDTTSSHCEQSDIGIKEEGSRSNIVIKVYLSARDRVLFHGSLAESPLQSGGVLVSD